jgi:dihydroorotate dehydrogenase (NAD+) catalytic subunit
MPDLRVSLGSLTLHNPVVVAAGTFGYGIEFARTVPLNRLGGVITKTLTRQPRSGHPPPRLIETPSGLLNAVGLQNIGLDAFLAEKLPVLQRAGVPIIVSILGESMEDVAVNLPQLMPLATQSRLSRKNMSLVVAAFMIPLAQTTAPCVIEFFSPISVLIFFKRSISV